VDAGGETPLLLFDGDCAFCTTSVAWLAKRLHRNKSRSAKLSPWQYVDLVDLGIERAQAQREVVWVRPDGSHEGGAAAVAAWLIHSGRLYSLVGRIIQLPLIRGVAAAGYRLIAANRHRLPGGAPACASPPRGYDPTEPASRSL
jgi:predicted DCC family thiol-disulfide oxidoreductase YuxK